MFLGSSAISNLHPSRHEKSVLRRFVAVLWAVCVLSLQTPRAMALLCIESPLKAGDFCYEYSRHNVTKHWHTHEQQSKGRTFDEQAQSDFSRTWNHVPLSHQTPACREALKRFICHTLFPLCHPHLESGDNTIFLPCQLLCRKVNKECKFDIRCTFKHTVCVDDVLDMKKEGKLEHLYRKNAAKRPQHAGSGDAKRVGHQFGGNMRDGQVSITLGGASASSAHLSPQLSQSSDSSNGDNPEDDVRSLAYWRRVLGLLKSPLVLAGLLPVLYLLFRLLRSVLWPSEQEADVMKVQ